MNLRGRQVLVVGAASSGMAAARVLRDEGAVVRISEARTLDELGPDAADGSGVEVLAGGHRPEHLDGAELVVTSPGVPEHADVLRWADDRRVPVWSELELGARLARAPYVGVTGTNGKTTTTEMVAAAMRASGLDAIACGNVGYPFSLAAAEGHEALAVEASSFQLRFQDSFHPRVSVLLNIAPDHLDWHGSFEAYRDAKRRIFVRQGGDDRHVGNRDDEEAASISRDAPCPVAWFTLGAPGEGEMGYVGAELVLGEAPARGRSLGEPSSGTPAHRADAASAALAAVSFGLPVETVGPAVTALPPLPHRGGVVAEIDGVKFVDDSKATNPHAALAAVSGRRDVVLIAGGRSKGIDLSPLRDAVPTLLGVVVIGEAADELDRLFSDAVPVERASTIEDAAERALRMARPGASVVLAPACASQDMFRDYRERGERFAAAARDLASRPAAIGPGGGEDRRRA